MTLLIVDTTVLSNFARIDRVDLLGLALNGSGAMTEIVYTELQAGEILGRFPVSDWGWLPIIQLTTEETALYERLTLQLDNGEASCLALALTRGGVLVTDDQAARRYALSAGVAVVGTLGMLRILVRVGRCTQSEADNLLTAMIQQGYRSLLRTCRN